MTVPTAIISKVKPSQDSKGGPAIEFEFEVPNASQRPDVVVDGVKFWKVKPLAQTLRNDQPDQVYRNEEAKWRAVTVENIGLYARGQPTLIGTTSQTIPTSTAGQAPSESKPRGTCANRTATRQRARKHATGICDLSP